MRRYAIGPDVRGIIFDMDNTLYTHEGYARHQEDVLVERLAVELGVGPEEAAERVATTRRELAVANGGRKPSLGTTFLALGVPIATSVAWRERHIEPERYLAPDPRLAATLADLAGRFRLAVVTNNPVATARRTLAVLGIGDCFRSIVGLDTTGVSKPDPAAFRLAGEALGLEPGQVVSVGDRYEIDIEPALGLGMGGVLVDGVEDVYALPEWLGKS